MQNIEFFWVTLIYGDTINAGNKPRGKPFAGLRCYVLAMLSIEFLWVTPTDISPTMLAIRSEASRSPAVLGVD
jgi:hypothetical protein